MHCTLRCALWVLAIIQIAGVPAFGSAQDPASSTTLVTNVIDLHIPFKAADGTPLEAKLSIPAGAKRPVPVVFYLHGAGPRTFDNSIKYRNAAGEACVYRYFDFHSHQLALRGVAFFRISKRGCTIDSSGEPEIDWSVFKKATPSVLLNDYARALDTLRERAEIDTNRIILLASSEGTRLAPRLATRSPRGIAGLALMSYQSVNLRETIVWQNTLGPWRNIQKLTPAAADGRLTRGEYDEAAKKNRPLPLLLPFSSLDTDADGTMTTEELAGLTRQRLEAIMKAVDERNDDFIRKALLNLSTAYLLDDWNGDPTHLALRKLDLPIAIFHGELDGTTSIEGVREAAAALEASGRTNWLVRAYPEHDHDLNWTIQNASEGGPAPFQDAFAWVAKLVNRTKSP